MGQNFRILNFDQLFQNLSQLNANTWIFTTLFDHLTHNFMKEFMLLKSDVSLKPGGITSSLLRLQICSYVLQNYSIVPGERILGASQRCKSCSWNPMEAVWCVLLVEKRNLLSNCVLPVWRFPVRVGCHNGLCVVLLPKVACCMLLWKTIPIFKILVPFLLGVCVPFILLMVWPTIGEQWRGRLSIFAGYFSQILNAAAASPNSQWCGSCGDSSLRCGAWVFHSERCSLPLSIVCCPKNETKSLLSQKASSHSLQVPWIKEGASNGRSQSQGFKTSFMKKDLDLGTFKP